MSSEKDLLILKLKKERDLWKSRAMNLKRNYSDEKDNYINTRWKNKNTDETVTIVWHSINKNNVINFDLLDEDGNYKYLLSEKKLLDTYTKIYNINHEEFIGYAYGC